MAGDDGVDEDDGTVAARFLEARGGVGEGAVRRVEEIAREDDGIVERNKEGLMVEVIAHGASTNFFTASARSISVAGGFSNFSDEAHAMPVPGPRRPWVPRTRDALVLTLITSLLTALQLPEAFRLMILGLILLILLSVYGRQAGLRQ